MRKTSEKWKNFIARCRNLLRGWTGAFFILAFVFLAVGLGTIGSPYGTGKAYELRAQQSGDEQRPAVVFHLDNLTEREKDGATKTTNLRLMGVYVNIASIYADAGTPATLRIERRTSNGDSYTSPLDATFENIVSENGKETEVKDAFFRFVSPFSLPETGWRVSTYPYIRLSAMSAGANVLVNEVVFYGEKLDSSNNGTGQFCRIPATVYEATPYANESVQDAIRRAGALLDAQRLPIASQSSYHNFTEDEKAALTTIAEMRLGSSYAADANGNAVDTYHIDRTSGALGIDLLALGTLIFGMSPFGLRIFPMLAVFGTLLLLARFCVRLFRSERAGFVFSVLFAASNLAFGIGHLGTPAAIGIFFFALALYLVHKFYADGMNVGTAAALPLLAAGLSCACAILTNGAFVLPVFGVVVLFLFAMVRQQQVYAYTLNRVMNTPEREIDLGVSPEEAKAAHVMEVKAEYRFKNIAAPVLFGIGLIVGAFVVSLLALLPAYFVYLKAYVGPGTTASLFTLGWKVFAGGFTGVNEFAGGSPWLFYEVFRGTGNVYAVTALVSNLVAVLCAVAGGVMLAVRLAKAHRGGDKKATRQLLRRLILPLAGAVLAIIAALAVKEALCFIVLAQFMLYPLAAGYGKGKPDVYEIVLLVLLSIAFLLAAVFTFSIPLPASFLGAILG